MQCRICGVVKTPSDYYENKTACKACCIVRSRLNRQARGDAYREWERAHWKANPKRRADKGERTKRWRERNPEKYRAQVTAGNAWLRGLIVKANACSSCGVSGKVEAHHDDYSQPLKVRWLCKRCHYKADRRLA